MGGRRRERVGMKREGEAGMEGEGGWMVGREGEGERGKVDRRKGEGEIRRLDGKKSRGGRGGA